MSTFSASVATTGFALLLFAAAVPTHSQTETDTQPQTQVSVSKVRIVRLSQIRGAVQFDRSNGHGYEPAIINLPVVEQNRLKTTVGVAEVEFEDNSTLRVGPDSEVQFALLGRTGEGNTVSTIRLVSGTAYVSLVKGGGKAANMFDVAFGDRTIHLQPDTHVRLEMDDQRAKLAVLSGTVHVDGPNGAMDISRKNTATFALAGDTQPAVAKGIGAESLDAWDKQLDQYHSSVASLTNVGGVPYSYGLSDMSYYGAFANTGGCGMMWRPYFASAAWDPYGNGTWAYYTGAGYSWVSPYPWGWTPYHYGSWAFCPGAGWGWTPGGSWMGLNNIASATPATPGNGITGGRRLPVAPQPPRAGGLSLVSVNQTALVHSGLDSPGSFVFRKDSAGLGIPRNELGDLKGFSERAVQKGATATPIYLMSNGIRGVSNAPAPAVIQRGYAPSYGHISIAEPSSSSSVGSTSSVPTPSPSATTSAHATGGGSHH
jgi:FecR protein